MEISNLTLPELLDLQKAIPAEIKRRQAREKNALLSEVKKMVEERGFSFEELMGKEGKVRAAIKVKYRHPGNIDLTWTGRGRTPKWVTEWEVANGSLDGLRVD